MIVTGGQHAGDFLKLLANGSKDFGLKHINYTYQEGEGGIAEALSLCEHFVDREKVCVVLGDNIIEKNIAAAVAEFKAQDKGGKIMLKQVKDPERFGVPRFEKEQIVEIIEKPQEAPSPYAVIGIYMYDEQVWDVIHGLTPSARGELEITDVNNFYINQGSLTWSELDGWWSDAGTFESLLKTSNLVADTGANKI